MSLIITTPPTTEPVTLDEVKKRLRLTSTDDDATITQQITAAREFAEKVTRRSLTVKSYRLSLDAFPWFGTIHLPAPPLVSVDAIGYVDTDYATQTLDLSTVFVSRIFGGINLKTSFFYPQTALVPGAVTIDFTAGYGDATTEAVPEHLKEGIRQLAVHMYEHPEAVNGENMTEIPLALMSFFTANKKPVF